MGMYLKTTDKHTLSPSLSLLGAERVCAVKESHKQTTLTSLQNNFSTE